MNKKCKKQEEIIKFMIALAVIGSVLQIIGIFILSFQFNFITIMGLILYSGGIASITLFFFIYVYLCFLYKKPK